MKFLLWIALAATAALQLGLAGFLIARHELTLSEGVEVKIRCAPRDPFDPFRGRYVALAFGDEAGLTKVAEGVDLPEHGAAYASFEVGDDGFARFTGLSAQRPDPGDLFLKVGVRYGRPYFTFDRFYMNEVLAPAAEEAYRRAVGRRRDEPDKLPDAWAALRVRRGLGVIEQLYVGGRPIGEVAAGHLAAPPDEGA